jgi:eukaryotic-like serine/threonine-protein kinase
MKRCPECGREYDNSMMFCLDDGAELLYGPAALDEPPTAILVALPVDGQVGGEAATRGQIKTSEKTAVLTSRAESEPEQNSTRVSEKVSLSANRAAKPLLIAAAAAVLLIAAFVAYRYVTAGSSKQIESIAVMPFVNESANPDNEYVSEGIAESLISSLSQVPGISVKARSTVSRYKGKENTPGSVGKELNVQAILNGRVLQRGDRLTLSLELIDPDTENVIWSQSYSRKQSELVLLQREVVDEVSNKLKLRLTGTDREKLGKNYTANSDAYRSYLQGRFHWNKRTVPDIQKSVEYFQQSIQLDPTYALGYAGLADAYTLLTLYHATQPADSYPKAREAALKALSLDQNLAEAHASLGFVTMNDYYPVHDAAAAESEYLRAIELNPNLATTYHYYALLLGSIQRKDEAVAQIRKAIDIEPFSSLFNRSLGDRLLEARLYDEAISQFKKTLELDGGFGTALYGLGIAYQMRGEHEQAVENFARYQEVSGDSGAAAILRETFGKAGWKGFLRVMVAGTVKFNVAWHTPAAIYASLGEHDKAFDELDEAYRKRAPEVLFLNTDPRLEPLRGDARMSEMMRRLNIPE